MTNKEMFMRRLAPAEKSKCNHQRRTAMLNKTSSLFLLLMMMSAAMYTSPASASHPSKNLGEVTVVRYVHSDWVSIAPGTFRTLFSRCSSTQAVIGGGWETRDLPTALAKIRVFKNYPITNTEWRVVLENQDTVARDVKIYRICAE